MSTDVTGAETPLSTLVAEEIRGWMGKRRISGAALARALGKSTAWVSYRLTGQQEIGLNDLQQIADVLGVEVTDLLPRPMPGRLLTTVGTPNVHSDASAVRPARTRPARKRSPIGRPRREAKAPASAVPPTQRRPALVSGPGQRIAA